MACPPKNRPFVDYSKAKPDLIRRIGFYCSYCERRLPTSLAVEHIQPKGGNHAYSELEGQWCNFLLACVNCNSTKGDKNVVLANVMLPDRDNTFLTYCYSEDGNVSVTVGLSAEASGAAAATLSMVGLNAGFDGAANSNERLVARDRIGQRMEAWLLANESKSEIDAQPNNGALRRQVVRSAQQSGFFNIWMAVFDNDADMRRRLIDAFPGTRQSGCFDLQSSDPSSPAPNPDGLANGGKA